MSVAATMLHHDTNQQLPSLNLQLSTGAVTVDRNSVGKELTEAKQRLSVTVQAWKTAAGTAAPGDRRSEPPTTTWSPASMPERIST